jgi:hypothetical protein
MRLPFDDEDAASLIDSEILRSEPRGFAPDQMVRCEECLRANPPTRTACLYCAAQLPANEANSTLRKPTLRRLEKWEQGFNVILLPGITSGLTAEMLPEMADLLRVEIEDLRRIIEAKEPLPVARLATLNDASLMESKLSEMGAKGLIIADDVLQAEEFAPKRARGLKLTESALVLYPVGGGEAGRVLWEEVRLLVLGRLFVREIEVEERKKRRAENEIVDARELNSDEAVVDIYTTQGTTIWRITADNFDFSCLNAEKKLIAAQNFSTLVELLRTRAAKVVYDESYTRVRQMLAAAWPLEQETESRGWRRKGPGRVSTEAVTRSDNDIQFTRYSRLRFYLELHQPELSA